MRRGRGEKTGNRPRCGGGRAPGRQAENEGGGRGGGPPPLLSPPPTRGGPGAPPPPPPPGRAPGARVPPGPPPAVRGRGMGGAGAATGGKDRAPGGESAFKSRGAHADGSGNSCAVGLTANGLRPERDGGETRRLCVQAHSKSAITIA